MVTETINSSSVYKTHFFLQKKRKRHTWGRVRGRAWGRVLTAAFSNRQIFTRAILNIFTRTVLFFVYLHV